MMKYPAMRSGASGIYAAATEMMGFDLCMLNMTQLNSYYRDPYLQAVLAQCDAGTRKTMADSRFYGWDHYRAKDRWLTLQDSGERLISCRQTGFQLCAPHDPGALSRGLPVRYGGGASHRPWPCPRRPTSRPSPTRRLDFYSGKGASAPEQTSERLTS